MSHMDSFSHNDARSEKNAPNRCSPVPKLCVGALRWEGNLFFPHVMAGKNLMMFTVEQGLVQALAPEGR
jgi:hypothetical protein